MVGTMQAISKHWHKVVALFAVLLLSTGCNSFAASLNFNPWEVVSLPTESTLLDVGFITPEHGWLVGTHGALFETFDGGSNWEPRALALDEDQDYRFNAVSFEGQEGWVIGEPSILLHTTDGGQSWSRVALSAKLPGAPSTVVALGNNSAEMTTDLGAIYRTEDGGQTWKGLVQEALGVIRNIERSPEGKYVAVSSRGSFYSTWEPGQQAWEPHNRNSSRRVQNMGFATGDRLWMLSNGGQIQFSDPTEADAWEKVINPQVGVSVGLLDLAYRTPEEVWVSGGSGNLLCSLDGGKTWLKDTALESVPSNLYKIVFLNSEQGFILGQEGKILRYTGETSAT
jgi:photosystem II stability/assembly factor-like uncharacterized protein